VQGSLVNHRFTKAPLTELRQRTTAFIPTYLELQKMTRKAKKHKEDFM